MDSKRGSYGVITMPKLTFARWIVVSSVTLAAVSLMLASGLAASRSVAEESLDAQLAHYDNDGKPLIHTLVEIAAYYHIPMGIEKVTRESVHTPVHITLQRGTVRDLLNLCVRQFPDYHWAVEKGTIDIYGDQERKRESNLFNYVVPMLEVKGGDLNVANAMLRMLMPRNAIAVQTKPKLRPGEVYGVAGDSPGVGGLEPTHTDLEFRNSTVRSILNQIVALSKGKVIWVARVPPERLSHAPDAGLWLLLPPTADITSELDPSLTR